MVSDRFSAYEVLSFKQRGICRAHLSRDFQRIAERSQAAGTLGQALLNVAAQAPP
jgi:transposase